MHCYESQPDKYIVPPCGRDMFNYMASPALVLAYSGHAKAVPLSDMGNVAGRAAGTSPAERGEPGGAEPNRTEPGSIGQNRAEPN